MDPLLIAVLALILFCVVSVIVLVFFMVMLEAAFGPDNELEDRLLHQEDYEPRYDKH